MKTYKPSAGEHISEASKNAVKLAQETNDLVTFSFNDIKVQVGPGVKPESVEAEWQRRQEEAAKAYRNSPEKKAADEQWARKLAWYQSTVDKDLERLPRVLKRSLNSKKVDPVIRWLASFSRAAGWRGIDYDKEKLIQLLENAGFIAGEHVGQPQEFFEVPENKGRYIVGQFLSCLKELGCYPDILTSWCEEFAEAR